jgi:DNA polymerase-1
MKGYEELADGVKKYDIEVKGELFDTLIAHYLLQPEQRHNLNYLSETYLGYSPVKIEDLIGQKGANQGNMKNVLVPEKTLLAFQVLPYLWLRHPLL